MMILRLRLRAVFGTARCAARLVVALLPTVTSLTEALIQTAPRAIETEQQAVVNDIGEASRRDPFH